MVQTAIDLVIAALLIAALIIFAWRQFRPYPQTLKDIQDAASSGTPVVVVRERRGDGETVHFQCGQCSIIYGRSYNEPYETLRCALPMPRGTVKRFEATFNWRTGEIQEWKENGKRAFHRISNRDKLVARALLNRIRTAAGYRW